MDVLEEKMNGAPPMEIIDDVVSVLDRRSPIFTQNDPLVDIPTR